VWHITGRLSNHAPMAADALIRLGGSDGVHRWIDCYLARLDEAPTGRWPIDPVNWRDSLGDPSRLGDWLRFFERQLAEHPWQDILALWWPRLLPGAIGAVGHPLIRTGHAVRAIQESLTDVRVAELGQALGYWAARWTPLPRMEPLGCTPPAELSQIPMLLDELTDSAVGCYRQWASSSPVMLIHAATVPRAARLVLLAVPEELWPMSYRHTWAATAAIVSAYRPQGRGPAEPAVPPKLSAEIVADAAMSSSDAHALKFTEVALESHARGLTDALAAAYLSSSLVEDG
jgi:hypothetical protein